MEVFEGNRRNKKSAALKKALQHGRKMEARMRQRVIQMFVHNAEELLALDSSVESVTDITSTMVTHEAMIHACPDILLKVTYRDAGGKVISMRIVIDIKAPTWHGRRKKASEAYCMAPFPLAMKGELPNGVNEQVWLPCPTQYAAQAAYYSHVLHCHAAFVCICTESDGHDIHFVTIPHAEVVGKWMVLKVQQYLKNDGRKKMKRRLENMQKRKRKKENKKKKKKKGKKKKQGNKRKRAEKKRSLEPASCVDIGDDIDAEQSCWQQSCSADLSLADDASVVAVNDNGSLVVIGSANGPI